MSLNSCMIIKEGDYIIAKSETALRLVQLLKHKPFFLGKRKVHFYSVVGHDYNSYFDIKPNGTLEIQNNPMSTQDLVIKTRENAEVKDNRALINTGDSQKLTTDDIESLKTKGVSGGDMIKIIVENSSSFHEKSAFSQEKYLRKKHLKYVNCVQILKPNLRLLCEMYYSQNPAKICNLRIDSLSLMLSFCNVMSGGKFMVIDSVMGLLTASVLERMGENGCTVQLHIGPFSVSKQAQAVSALNLSEEELKSVLYNVDFKDVINILKNGQSKTDDDVEMNKCIGQNDTVPSENKKKEEKLRQLGYAQQLFLNKEFDSLLVATKSHPSNLLPLLDFLCPSRPFAIFFLYQLPLVDCYTALKSRGDIIHLNISETWLRKYQVLPERTHPDHMMSGSGGYLLTGIRVDQKSVVPPTVNNAD